MPFQPPFLLSNPHVQTVWGYFMKNPAMPAGKQHRVATYDDDLVVVHENRPVGWPAGEKPAVLLVHGLCGSHESGYIQRVGLRFLQLGWSVFRFDMRGCGASVSLSKGIFHAARAADLRTVIESLQPQLMGSPLTVAGFSLGANLLLRMLGEAGADAKDLIKLGIAVAPPIELGVCCRQLSRGLSLGYDQFFVRLLWREFRQRRPLLAQAHCATAPHRPATLLAFDQQVTAPVAGFPSADAYYEAASAKPLLNQIRVPTRILVAQDDPVVPYATYVDARFSKSCRLLVTPRGGHLGYVAARNVELANELVTDHVAMGRRFMDWQLITWAMEEMNSPI